MSADHSADNDAIEYGHPASHEAGAVARLFLEDMTQLGVSTSYDRMHQFARAVVDACASEPPECLCWVARAMPTDEVCGVVLANFNWSLKFGGRALWIEELFVSPNHRRKGIGRALVGLVVDYAEDNDIQGIDLEAYQGNTPASILYRTMGFHRLGRERFYYRVGPAEYL